MTNLTILNNSIRSYGNLYSLNDLHQASGGLDKHSPFRFMRNESTQELISEMKNEMNTKSGVQKEAQGSDLIFKTLRGRNIQGTWVCEELVLSYAMWISPKFHLIVLRAFLAMHRNQPQQLALPEPEKKYTREFTEHDLQQLVWAWFALLRGTELCQVLHPALKQIGSHYAASVYSMAYEYRSTLRHAHNVLTRITEQFECEQGNNWRVLKYLRAYNPKATGFQLDIL
ncbi:bacteriocin [Haemophilus influenzae biotype aegyptius]|uniref:P22AR C-terminal domain-containing protein n=1 Tax=Haemophilus influenzae TaxID=727 RepID=UPI0001F37170|nr:P22AR C-terminal domain-containing protein [Haemophilus influenzae]QEQ61199.1 bacteriocin [Haemophilus influenzae biotype aegyptius]QEQ63307.1 bacteriocin [Haemophilus influenzae biotype aegyptius]QEQ64759.1 bacteriocin [Haemophilus influenzae biotype aegyptius]TMQ38692.1 bacteriocin [Haemophilus influenzae biotype aegyptius]TMQ39834.1 bacteriocin [Haemophilus influenzae biotype aegyptius]